jgi:hypothetical protein
VKSVVPLKKSEKNHFVVAMRKLLAYVVCVAASDANQIQNMNTEQIENLPSAMEANYCDFRDRIRAELADALENGDAELAMRKIYGDFMKALSHTLDEYDAPAGILARITQ